MEDIRIVNDHHITPLEQEKGSGKEAMKLVLISKSSVRISMTNWTIMARKLKRLVRMEVRNLMIGVKVEPIRRGMEAEMKIRGEVWEIGLEEEERGALVREEEGVLVLEEMSRK